MERELDLTLLKKNMLFRNLTDGEILERGSHEELLEQKGRYYQLYTGMYELQ